VRARLVLCGGEVVEAAARRVIEEGFSAALIDFYGAHEFNLLASQCPAGVYHVCDDNVLLEIVDETGRPVKSGEIGEVVATALHSYTMPFVRYRTGDLATRGQGTCGCGQPFSTLHAIQGRAVDYLCLPNGRRVHPYAITVALAEREADWVSQHQLVQTRDGRVELKVLPRRAPRLEELQRLRVFATTVLGSGVDLDIALVERFPRHPSGKFRPYVSRPAEADMQSPRAYPG
jgi:phenylacetate-CoA ligase